MDAGGSLDLHWLAPHPALRPAIKAAQASLDSDPAKAFADLRALLAHGGVSGATGAWLDTRADLVRALSR